jgi:uncharacterized membrane protein
MGLYTPVILRNPQFLVFLAVIPALALAWRLRRGRVSGAALVLRLVAVTLIVVALSDPIVGGSAPTPGMLVLLLDQSDSLGAAGKAALLAQSNRIAAAHGGKVATIVFGANAVAGPSSGSQPTGAAVRADNTDIAAALRAARGLAGAGGGRILLLSDGAQTRGDALAMARSLGVPIDTLAYQPASRPEIWIAAIEVPATLRTGEDYTITIVVGSSEATTAQLKLFDSTAQLAAQQLALSVGENRFTYHSQAGKPGIERLRATIDGQPDTFAQNNSAAATALVAPQPRVLIVESVAGTVAPLRAGLRTAGVRSDVVAAGSLPTQLSALEAYEGIVLVDVPAGDLTLDQMATLREFVRSEGRGLVATGGRSSFTLGAYKNTPLEEVLPVAMTPPPRPERPPVTLLLIIDKSASMGSTSGISKFDMAKESAILATEALREEDRIGILTFDTGHEWVVDFQTLGAGLSLGEIQERIGQIAIGGGTDIYNALSVGLSELASQPGEARHAVLLTDGRSFSTTRGPYQDVVARAREQNITLSAIAIGEDSDTELLQDLARWGAGRYHFAGQPEDIPRLTLLESQIASAEPQIEGNFRAELQAPHPLLREFAPNQIPKLEGYVGTTIKPEAELVLKSPEGDPVLATWQYGLGRAVAWTPSVEAPWAESWSNWPDYGKFWAQIIRYTLPEPDSGPLQIRTVPHGEGVTISVDSLSLSGEPLDLADTEATFKLPDGSARTIVLRQTAPGRYAEDVALPSDGPYTIDVQQRKGDALYSASAGYVQRPSDEYLPAGDGTALLGQISAATGGSVLSSTAGPLAAAPATTNDTRSFWPWLLLAAALLWPIEIALRRGWLLLLRGHS